MVRFLARRPEQHVPRPPGAGSEGLAVIKGLGSHFPGMIYPHQRPGLTPFGIGQLGNGTGRGQGAGSLSGGENRA
jgi:hypothetical protein